MGWTEMGNVSSLSRDDLKTVYRRTYRAQAAKGVITRDVNALWAFYHEIHEGDVIVRAEGENESSQ